MENTQNNKKDLEANVHGREFYRMGNLPDPWEGLASMVVSIGFFGATFGAVIPYGLIQDYLISKGYETQVAQNYGAYSAFAWAGLMMCVGFIGSSYCFSKGVERAKVEKLQNKARGESFSELPGWAV